MWRGFLNLTLSIEFWVQDFEFWNSNYIRLKNRTSIISDTHMREIILLVCIQYSWCEVWMCVSLYSRPSWQVLIAVTWVWPLRYESIASTNVVRACVRGMAWNQSRGYGGLVLFFTLLGSTVHVGVTCESIDLRALCRQHRQTLHSRMPTDRPS